MRHTGAHLVLDHCICTFDQQIHKFCMALMVPDQIKDVFYDLPPIVEPARTARSQEQVRCPCRPVRSTVAYEREIEGAFGRFTSVTDTGNRRAGAG